jgi:hypothetical protein
MDEITLISMNIYHIEVNHFKYEIIWQNIQEKIADIFWRSDRNIRPSGTHPSLVTAQYAGPLGTGIRSEQHNHKKYMKMADSVWLSLYE